MHDLCFVDKRFKTNYNPHILKKAISKKICLSADISAIEILFSTLGRKQVSRHFVRHFHSSSLLIIVYILLFLVMLLFSFLTPYCRDDFSYSFSFADNTRISSISQIIPSMMVHREILNGRVIPHAIVQLLLMLPKSVFNICNAVNAVLLTYMASKFLYHSTGRSNSKGKTISIVLFITCIWSFSPAFGENYLWLDGSVNYAWTLSLSTFFLWPYAAAYLNIPRTEGLIEKLLRIIAAIIMGSCSENISLVFLFLAVCISFLVWARDRKLYAELYLWILFGIVGYVFLMSSPATVG